MSAQPRAKLSLVSPWLCCIGLWCNPACICWQGPNWVCWRGLVDGVLEHDVAVTSASAPVLCKPQKYRWYNGIVHVLCSCRTSTGGSSHSRASSRYEAAAAGSAGTSPVRQLAFAAHSPRPGDSPQLGMTPGSVYSTPTLTMAQLGGAGGRTQVGRAAVWLAQQGLSCTSA